MMKNKMLLWAAVAVGVVLVVWFMVGTKNKGPGEVGVSPSPSSSAKATSKSGTILNKTGSATTSTKTYSQLVAEYKDRRIQFDMTCQASPNTLTFKNGTTIMLDNRSGDARTITIGTAKYNLVGYGYAVVTLSSPTTPKELVLGCGSAINVGKVLIQANISNSY